MSTNYDYDINYIYILYTPYLFLHTFYIQFIYILYKVYIHHIYILQILFVFYIHFIHILYTFYIHFIYTLYTLYIQFIYFVYNFYTLFTLFQMFWSCSGQVLGVKHKFFQKVLGTFELYFGIIGGVYGEVEKSQK